MSSLEDVLSKSQRNDLFRAVEQSGAPLAEFELKTGKLGGQGNRLCVFINHRHSESFFGIAPRSNGLFRIQGHLGDDERLATNVQKYARFLDILALPVSNSISWPRVPPLAEKWARKIIELGEEYAHTPDLWVELRQSKTLSAAPHGNTSFTEAEQVQISSQMQRIRTYITTTYELTADQLSDMKERLDHVEEASRRLGRKDWLMLFNGAVFSLILADLVPPQAAQHVLVLALHGIGHLFGLGGPPTPLPLFVAMFQVIIGF